MSTEDKKTDNELIAEFMGLERREANKTYGKARYYKRGGKKSEDGFFAYYDSLPYHEDWNELIPVVHKILRSTEPRPGEGWCYEYIQLETTRIGNKIEFIHDLVVRFIRWYNTQPK